MHSRVKAQLMDMKQSSVYGQGSVNNQGQVCDQCPDSDGHKVRVHSWNLELWLTGRVPAQHAQSPGFHP